MIYVFLATGFEDIEALAPVDIMRRAGLAVETVSITGELVVMSAHGVGIMADTYIEDIDFDDADMIVLPGGLPGATNLDACASLRKGIMKLYEEGKPLVIWESWMVAMLRVILAWRATWLEQTIRARW